MILVFGDIVIFVTRMLGCHRNTIMRLRECFQQTGRVADRPLSGRPRVTDVRLDSVISLMHVRERFKTASSSSRQYGINKFTVRGRKTNLILVQDNFNAQGYVDQILRPEAVPFL